MAIDHHHVQRLGHTCGTSRRQSCTSDAGHWALETNLGEIAAIVRDFLGRVHGGESAQS